MKKNKISKNWINKQRRDIYVRKSKIEGYRSRAIYKLKEIDEKFKILKNVVTAIDLGAAPGSWSQYLSQKINHGKILAIDILEFQKINKVHQLIGDFTNENSKEKIRDYFNKKVYSTVIPRNVRLSEAPSHGMPVLLYDKTCPGSKAYFSFTDEFLNQETTMGSAA